MLSSLLVLGVIAFLVAIPIALSLRRRRQRTEAMRRAAKELGLSFFATGQVDLLTGLASSYLFSQGTGKTLANVMHGTSEDLEVKIFDFGYVRGGEDSQQYSLQTVICFRSPELDLPAFCLRPKSVFHRIAKLFGYQDIVVDGRSAFSRTYLLRGQDEAAVRKLFNEGVLAYYERSTSLFTEGNGKELIFYRWGQRVDPEQIRFFVQEGFEVLSLFWQASAGRRQELPDDFRQRFGVRVPGDVSTAPDRHSAGIRQPGQ